MLARIFLGNVSEANALDKDGMEILSKAFAPGEFLLGKDFTNATPQYLKTLSTTSLWGQEKNNWDEIDVDSLIRGRHHGQEWR